MKVPVCLLLILPNVAFPPIVGGLCDSPLARALAASCMHVAGRGQGEMVTPGMKVDPFSQLEMENFLCLAWPPWALSFHRSVVHERGVPVSREKWASWTVVRFGVAVYAKVGC